jgi:hypothetical protein
MVMALPAFAGGGIGQLAPLGGLAYQPYQQPYYQPPPRMETIVPDGLGGYHVYAPNRPMTTVQPDGFGGYHIYNGR